MGAEYCAPSDQQRPLWILMFEDVMQGINVYEDEDEAREAWELLCGPSGNWNGTLLQVVKRRAD